VVLAAGRRFGGDRAVHNLPVSNLVLVSRSALDDPAIQVLAVEQTGPSRLAALDFGGQGQVAGHQQRQAWCKSYHDSFPWSLAKP
jgi:hypothetical protein